MASSTTTSGKLALISVILLMLGTLALVPASAETQYQMFVFEKDITYLVGENARIEVYVFDRDGYINCDELNISMGMWPNERYVAVDETAALRSTGVYQVSFTLQEEDKLGSNYYGNARCLLDQGRNGMEEVASESFWLYSANEGGEGFDIEVETSRELLAPGDEVTFTVTFTNDSEKVDPLESGVIVVNFRGPGGTAEDGNLSMLTKESKGVYTYSNTIPANLTKAGEVILSVSADYGDDSDWDRATTQLKFYDVWVKQESFTATTFKGAVYVNDMTGKGVKTAKVSVYYKYRKNMEARASEIVSKWVNGTTDATGKFDLDIQLTGFDLDHLELEVTIESDFTDTIVGDLDYSGEGAFSPDEPYEYGLDIVAQEDYGDLEEGQPATLKFKTYYQGSTTSMSNVQLYYYIIEQAYHVDDDGLDSPILAVGQVTTDGEGSFSLPFTPSANGCENVGVTVKINVTDEGWRSADNYDVGCGDDVEKDPSVSISITNFGVGNQISLTASKSGVEGYAYFMVAPLGDTEEIDIGNAEDLDVILWERFERGIFMEPERLGEFEGGKATTSFWLPEFLPADENYLIMVLVFGEDELLMNYMIVDSKGNSVSVGEEDGFLPGPGLVLPLTTLALMALAWHPAGRKTPRQPRKNERA